MFVWERGTAARMVGPLTVSYRGKFHRLFCGVLCSEGTEPQGNLSSEHVNWHAGCICDYDAVVRLPAVSLFVV